MQLFNYTELLDLPKHNGAIRYLKVWNFWSNLLQIALLWIVACAAFLMAAIGFDLKPPAVTLAGCLAALVYAVLRTYHHLNPRLVCSALSTLGLAGGVGYYFYLKSGDVDGGKLAFSALAGLGIGLATTVALLFMEFAVALTAIIRDGINWLPAMVARQIFQLCFPAWKGVAHLGPRGYENLFPARLREQRVFVANKKLRRNGKAASELGIPLFTWQDLHANGQVRHVMQQWIQTAQNAPAGSSSALPGFDGALVGAAAGAAGFALVDLTELNTMMQDINPATGLPMIDGIGSLDVAGNTYGMANTSDMGTGTNSFNDM